LEFAKQSRSDCAANYYGKREALATLTMTIRSHLAVAAIHSDEKVVEWGYERSLQGQPFQVAV
jgi:hypothetical protein